MDLSVLFHALLYGLVPTLIWLVFFVSEDREHPEPKAILARGFFAGMLAVILSISVEKLILAHLGESDATTVLWALAEESIKFFLALVFVFSSAAFDEALDALIYMICVALGFAALENTLYALTPLLNQEYIGGAEMSNLRFVGATLLHVVSSAVIGAAIAFAYYRRFLARIAAGIVGLILAAGLHAGFNLLIIELPEQHIFSVYLGIWLLVLGLIILAEKIRSLDHVHHLQINQRLYAKR